MAEFTETTTKTVNCPSCGDERVMKVGKRSGYQRYQCQSRDKKFRDNGTTKGHQFNSEVIGATIRDFYMGLSYKQLAEGMKHRYDISEPSKDSLYNWVKEYSDVGSYIQKDYPAHTGDHWVVDEMVVKVGGENLWHWDVMDKKTRFVLASRLARRRTLGEAAKTLRMARAAADRSPQTINTDGLPAYPRAIKDTFPGATHVVSEGIYEVINNNMSERLQGTYRSRVKTLRGLDSIETGQRYLDGYTLTYNYFREHESLGYKTPGEVAKTGFPYKEWADIVQPAEPFEEFTLDVVYEDILALPKLEVAIEELRKHSGTLHNPVTRLDEIRERIAEIDQRMANLYMAWENEDIEYEFYANRNRVLRDSKAKAQEDLNRTGAGLDDASVILSDPQAILDHSVDVKFFLQNETPVRARAWLNTFLKRYWVEPGYVTYEYSLPMPPGSANPGLTRHRVPLDEDFRPTTRSAPQARG